MNKTVGVIDIAAITMHWEIGNCQVGIAPENRFEVGRLFGECTGPEGNKNVSHRLACVFVINTP